MQWMALISRDSRSRTVKPRGPHAPHVAVQRLAGHCLEDPMEVEGGETTYTRQPAQRQIPVQVPAHILEDAVHAIVIVVLVPHDPRPQYIRVVPRLSQFILSCWTPERRVPS
jgi:hypothetical protein